MDNNLLYIGTFAIITLIALVVSFSLKYEKRDYGDGKTTPHTHTTHPDVQTPIAASAPAVNIANLVTNEEYQANQKIVDGKIKELTDKIEGLKTDTDDTTELTNLQSQIATLESQIATLKSQPPLAHIYQHISQFGTTGAVYSYDLNTSVPPTGTLTHTSSSSSPPESASIENINNLFKHTPGLNIPYDNWYWNQNGTKSMTNTQINLGNMNNVPGTKSYSLSNADGNGIVKTIPSNYFISSDGYLLSDADNKLAFGSGFVGQWLKVVTDNGSIQLVAITTGLPVLGGSLYKERYYTNYDTKNRILYSGGGKDGYVNINKLEYFGLTSNYYLPLSPTVPRSILGDADTDGWISEMSDISQTLSPNIRIESRRYGLFAKTREVAPTEVDSLDGFNGFTNATTNYRVEYITKKLTTGGDFSIPSLWSSNEITGGQPYYSIYVVLDTDEINKNNKYTFTDKNIIKGTQTVMIFGSPKSEYKYNHKDYAYFLPRENLTNDNKIPGKQDVFSIIKADAIPYCAYGEFNMNSICFMKFNSVGDQNAVNHVPVSYNTDTGWRITSGPAAGTGYKSYIPVNYGTTQSVYTLIDVDYRNYYEWDGISSYTHKYWNTSGDGAWTDV